MSRDDVLLGLAHALDHYVMLAFPAAVLAIQAETGRSYVELILLATGMQLAFGFGSIPAGWLGDLWSRRGMMLVYFAGLAVTSAGIAFSSSPLAWGVWLTLLGAAASIYHPVGLALVSEAENPERALSLNGVFGNLGTAAAPMVTLAASAWSGWQWAFILPSLAALILGLAFAAGSKGAAATVAAAPPEPASDSAGHDRKVIGLLLAGVAAGGLIYGTVNLTLPKFMDENAPGLSQLGVGTLTSVALTLSAIAQGVVGPLVRRHGLKETYLLLAPLQAALLAAAALASGLGAIVVVTVVMVAMSAQALLNDVIVARYSAPGRRARLYASRSMVAFTAGAAAPPLVAALYNPARGLGGVYAALSVVCLVIVAGSVLFPRSPRRDGPPSGPAHPRGLESSTMFKKETTS